MRAKLLDKLSKQTQKLRECGIVVSDEPSERAQIISDLAWSMSAVSSRAFHLNFSSCSPASNSPESINSRRLLPLIDFLNHSFDPACKVEATDSGLEVRSLRDIQAGEELTIKYGELSNDALLLDYGFIADENPFDTLQLKFHVESLLLACEISGLDCNYKQSSWKIKLIQQANIQDFQLIGQNLDQRLPVVIRILIAVDEDIRQAEQIDSEAWKASSLEDEQKVKNVLKSYFELILESFPTTIKQDIQLLAKSVQQAMDKSQANGANNELLEFTPSELAIRYRIAKKRLITEQLNRLQLS